MLTPMTMDIAWPLSEKNGWGETPTVWMISLTRPCWAKSIDQMSETTTQEVTTGKKYVVRSRVRKGMYSFMAMAMNSGSTVSPMTTKTVKNAVLRSAVRNSPSVARWVKLPPPTKAGVLLRVASKKLRYREYTS